VKTVIEKFRSLPEACRAFDSVWSLHKQEDEIRHLECQLAQARVEYSELERSALTDLRKFWSDEELNQAGFNVH
jgi:hypothetical protein